MGYINLIGMIEHAPHVALEWHLLHNHYPPIDRAFLPVAQRAIDLAREDGDLSLLLDLPNGRRLSVLRIIQGLHLEPFLEESTIEEDPQ